MASLCAGERQQRHDERRKQTLRWVMRGLLAIELILVVGILAGVIGPGPGETPHRAPSGAETEPGNLALGLAPPSGGDGGEVGAAGGERSHLRERKPEDAETDESKARPRPPPSAEPATPAPEPSEAPIVAPEPAPTPEPASPPEPAPPPAPTTPSAAELAADEGGGGPAGASNCQFTFEC